MVKRQLGHVLRMPITALLRKTVPLGDRYPGGLFGKKPPEADVINFC